MMKTNEPEPEVTPEQRAKAERAIWILYAVMIVFISAPFVVWWFFVR